MASVQRDLVPLREALRTWFAISLQSFGGPAGQVAVMQRILVDEKRWIGQERFLHALGYCTLLPGPEAQQLATYVGWLLNGTRGALAAGTLFCCPGCSRCSYWRRSRWRTAARPSSRRSSRAWRRRCSRSSSRPSSGSRAVPS